MSVIPLPTVRHATQEFVAPVRSDVFDVLRACAILLVLVHHQSAVAPVLHRIGWSGVDLFFVLSGYLVTGLLLRERRAFGDTQIARFLVRRGFKIYPAFWAMIAATLLVSRLAGRPVHPTAAYWELAFAQNYGPGLWASTWSLAVEEHFYLGIAALFFWIDRRGVALEPRAVMRAGLVLLIAIFVLRCLTVWLVPPNFKLVAWGTHARIDGLIFGALVAYAHQHRPASMAALVERHRFTIAGVSALLIATVFVSGYGRFTKTVGFTLLYLAYGGVLLLALHHPQPCSRAARCLAAIGRHSYGIYIWHQPLLILGVEPLARAGLLPPAVAAWPGTHFVVSILGGILLSRAIEVPVLRLRERWFPGRGRARPRAGTAAPRAMAHVGW